MKYPEFKEKFKNRSRREYLMNMIDEIIEQHGQTIDKPLGKITKIDRRGNKRRCHIISS